jgi:chromatin segregation and condensation protein Rec8/ScpA/Scc1 (kleisin family)
VTTGEDSFVLSRARELAAILSKRSEAFRFCFTHPRPRIPTDPITTVEDIPVEVDTIDLVATFQAILDRSRARDAPRDASRSQSQ